MLLDQKLNNKSYYVFPDIHGQADLLTAALAHLYQKHPEGGKVIFLGDYIDRGYDHKTVLETVMYPPENWEFICLKGNHEDMFLDAYDNHGAFFDINVLLHHYNGPGNAHYGVLHGKFPKEIIEWMRSLKLFHFEGNNVFAHAYYDAYTLPEMQNPSEVMWNRFDDWTTFASPLNNLYLTHGHTPRKHGPVKSPNRLNLDCGACFYGKYVIAEFVEGVTGPVDFKEFESNK